MAKKKFNLIKSKRPAPTTWREAFSRMSPKLQAFFHVYVDNGFNASAAAIAAGYTRKDATILKTKPIIITCLQLYIKELGLSQESLLFCLMRAINADLADFEPWLTGRKTLEQLKNEGVDTSVVSKLSISPRGKTIMTIDKLGALKLAADMLKYTRPANQVFINGDVKLYEKVDDGKTIIDLV